MTARPLSQTPSAPGPDTFRHTIRVYWEDTDAGGIVFYANYLKFFERARTEWLRSHGFGQQSIVEQTGCMFVVTDTRMKYRLPARLDDQLVISVEVKRAAAASLEIVQQAWCDGRLLVEGDIRIGFVERASMRPARIPADVYDALALVPAVLAGTRA